MCLKINQLKTQPCKGSSNSAPLVLGFNFGLGLDEKIRLMDLPCCHNEQQMTWTADRLIYMFSHSDLGGKAIYSDTRQI